MKNLLLLALLLTLSLNTIGCGASTNKKVDEQKNSVTTELKTEEISESNNEEIENETEEIIEETTKDVENETVKQKEQPSIEEISEKSEETSEKKQEIASIEVDYDKYSTVSLNIRNYPDKSGEKIGALAVNDKVNVVAEYENGWVKIVYNNNYGFVNSNYLSDTKVEIPEPEPPKTPENPPAETDTTVIVGKEGTYDYEAGVHAFNLVNNLRAQNGVGTLTWDNNLYETAKIRAAEASISWSHTRPNGSHWSTLSSQLHGENLAKGYATAEEAINAWCASEGHKANMLRSSFTRGAVAFFNTSNGWYWCNHFGY